MTIEEAQAIIAKTKSPYLKRDMKKFIIKKKTNALQVRNCNKRGLRLRNLDKL